MVEKKKLRLTELIFPVFLVICITAYCIYAVQCPQDSMVEKFLTGDKIFKKLIEHIKIVLISSSLAICTAFPLGVLLTRRAFKRYANFVVNIVNIGQTVPSLAVIAIFVGILGIGLKTALFAIWLYSLLPILVNTITGIQGVPGSVVNAARGMGMSKAHILFNIEIPLAFYVIMAGIRTAVVLNISTTVIAAFVGAGGLGDLIIAGNNISRIQVVIVGAGLSATMAIVADCLLGQLENIARN